MQWSTDVASRGFKQDACGFISSVDNGLLYLAWPRYGWHPVAMHKEQRKNRPSPKITSVSCFLHVLVFVKSHYRALKYKMNVQNIPRDYKQYLYSIKHPTRCTINRIFIALSRRHRSTCFGHSCAHHQEPPQTAFLASGYRIYSD
jgi:hypothetical protein